MFIDTTTNGAGTRGVARIDVDNLYAIQLSLVEEFVFKVVKCPAMQGGSLRLSNRYPVADAIQIFEGDATSSAADGVRTARRLKVSCDPIGLSLNHNAFADAVIGIVSETLFLVSLALQQSFGRECAFLLQLATQAAVAMTHAVDVAALVDLSIAVHGNVDDTPVHAQILLNVGGGWLLNLAGRQQIEFAIVIPQVALAFLVLEQFALAIPTDIRYFLPSAQHPDRHRLLVPPIGQNAAVIGDRAMFLERTQAILVRLVAVGNLTQTAYRQLGRQRVFAAQTLVQRTVQHELVKYLVFPGVVADRVAGGIRVLKRGFEQFCLLG